MLYPCDLRITQFSVLVALARRGAVPMTRFADILAMDWTILARSLCVLARQGLLTLDEGTDRHRQLVALTRQGSEVLVVAFFLLAVCPKPAG
jgi:DNA-binding MarR family transcriptional regulator